MRTVLILATGIWIGRQVYLKYDQAKIEKKERAVKFQLERYLKTQGLKAREVRKTVKSIINK